MVRLDTAFRDSPSSVSDMVSFEKALFRLHREAAHYTVAADSSLLTATIDWSKDVLGA